MKFITSLLFLCFFVNLAFAQSSFKEIIDQPYIAPKPISASNQPGDGIVTHRAVNPWTPGEVTYAGSTQSFVRSFKVEASGSLWIDFEPNDLMSVRSDLREVLNSVLPIDDENGALPLNWEVSRSHLDDFGVEHIRLQQVLGGFPIKGQDILIHLNEGSLNGINGFTWTSSVPDQIPDFHPADRALSAAKNHLVDEQVRFQEAGQLVTGFPQEADGAELIWYPVNGKLVLAYIVELHPNVMDHWTVYVDASSLEVLQAQSELCSLAPMHLYDEAVLSREKTRKELAKSGLSFPASPPVDGPTIVSDQDLFGLNRTVNAYAVGSSFYMIDASREMYRDNQSVMPDEPVGTIWTVDAMNSSPQQQNFQIVHATNNNNNWKNLEVSAHFNGGVAYEYFRQTFNRNSINGSGGNIVSIINVTDENDNDMDNAFWNGAAMFYGNGDVAFNAPLAKALDVAGHEMSHGVIQNTANLEYVGQSGALNESYADIFGAMIDRDDWQLAEDVANPGVFPSGAMRDLSNPNNGATGFGQPGWQPAHMNEFQVLPNTPQGDNGGVHVNSGIPNKAFFLIATDIGKDKAEQIYYKALTDYLVKSSQFIDMRNAAERAAKDLHGDESTEVIAVRNAFGTVGIGAGQGGDYEEDIEVNAGDDFVICTDENDSDLYFIPPDNPNQYVKMDVPAPISKPSFTDDGSACVYVDVDQNMIIINFDWTQGLSYQAFYLEDTPQGIWRNVVVSKDGTKIAYTTANLRNEIWVYDYGSGANDFFELYNPTTATGGINTGDVLYPDAMEWDYSGEYIMYDALNRIESQFGGGIEYWDIAFLHAWDKGINNMGSGQVGKLFSALPENISVGNASFAKNSPYIIVFDHLENYYNIFGQLLTEYKVKAANIESGELNDIYLNTTVGYPSYSRLDDKVLFTYNDNGTQLLATIDVQANNKTLPVAGTDQLFINGAQKGVWFATGNRIFTSTEEALAKDESIVVVPNPVSDMLRIVDDRINGKMTIEIINMTGKTFIRTETYASDQIDVTSLVPGAYLLKVISANGRIFHAKFIKQ